MFRLPLATAMRSVNWQVYTGVPLQRDILAGITVGIVAVPLAMALAIASGVPPQHGLYTSIVAGMMIAATGGSAVNISGPTAAFVVILLPISHRFGLGGLMLATVLAGMMLIVMGLLRTGRFIRLIPYPVTAGFTAGIGVVIALLQIKDFLGLEVQGNTVHFLERLRDILSALHTLNWPDLGIGVLTLALLRYWPTMRTHIPSHLVALTLAALAAWAGARFIDGFTVATIGSQFEFVLPNGGIGHGIPAVLPALAWPWTQPDAHGNPIGLSWSLITLLMGPAFTIAMLGAIESLLCAVVADGMTGQRHDPDAELVGQGLGNMVAPFFGGIAATAAIARTATNVRSGGRTPVAALVHSLIMLTGVIMLAPLLSLLPMAALAALLLMVAWHMADARGFVNMVRISPRGDVGVLLVCFFCTVVFDMVVAVSVGLILAAMIFIRRMMDLTGSELLDHREHEPLAGLPETVAVYDIDGPLFFGAADKTVSTLHHYRRSLRVVILDMTDVPMMDITGMLAVKELLQKLRSDGIAVVIACLAPRIEEKLVRAGVQADVAWLHFCGRLEDARDAALALSERP